MHPIISVIMPVYNNDLFVYQALENLVGFADEIIIIEGSWNPKNPNRSQDNTIALIQEFQQLNKKLVKILYYNAESNFNLNRASQKIVDNNQTYNPIVLSNELRCKQIALDNMRPDSKWWFLVDSDEVYKKEDLVTLRMFLDDIYSHDIAYRISIPAFVFYFNYKFGTKEHFQRINSVIDNDSTILYTDTLQYKDPNLEIVDLKLDPDLVFMYHYGYIGDERIKTKMSMWDKIESDKWYKETYLPIRNNEANLEEKNYHLFASKLGYGGKFEFFSGQHPHNVILDRY